MGFSPIRSGSAYLPVTAVHAVTAGISAKLFARTGTRPVIVAGTLIAAAGIFLLSRIPVHGTYLANLLPGLVVMAAGLGAVLVAVTTAAFLLVAALVALRASNTRGEPAAPSDAYDTRDQVPAGEPAD